MRIRTIKPEWLDDERLALAPSDVRVLSIALMLLSDDHGRGRANATVLGARVFPGSANPRETLAKALDTLGRLRFVVLYEVDGQSYYEIRNWTKHQKVDKPGKPQVPGIPEDFIYPENPPEGLAKVLGSLATDQDQDQEGTRKGKDQDHNSPGSSPGAEAAEPKRDLRPEIAALEARYPDGLPARVREGIALTRRSGAVATSVWHTTLRKLDAIPLADAVRAMQRYVDLYADGDKGEAYLLGIARREAASGARRPGNRHAGMRPPSPPEAFAQNPSLEDLDALWPEPPHV